MKNKKFDCVKIKLEIQEKLWHEAGETFQGLIELHNKMLKNNDLYDYFMERIEKEKQKTSV